MSAPSWDNSGQRKPHWEDDISGSINSNNSKNNTST